MSKKHWAIIGAGNGGQAFAAYLSLKGLDITIYDVFPETVDRLNKQGGIYIEGNSKVTGFGKILFASADIGEVIEGAEVILIILPSMYHKSIAAQMAPFLKDGQIVVGNPITPMGSMEFDGISTNDEIGRMIERELANELDAEEIAIDKELEEAKQKYGDV